MSITKEFLVSYDFFLLHIMEFNGDQQLLITHIVQNIFFCVKQEKETHTGLKQLEGEYMMIEFSFSGELCL